MIMIDQYEVTITIHDNATRAETTATFNVNQEGVKLIQELVNELNPLQYGYNKETHP